MDTQICTNMDINHTDVCSDKRDASFDPRITLDKYLPAEWHIYVLPRLRMGVILGKVKRCKMLHPIKYFENTKRQPFLKFYTLINLRFIHFYIFYSILT